MLKRKIGLTILFLATIPTWMWLIAPELKKLPKDFSFTANIVSTDNFYNEESKEFSGDQYSQTIYKYKPSPLTTIVLSSKTLLISVAWKIIQFVLLNDCIASIARHASTFLGWEIPLAMAICLRHKILLVENLLLIGMSITMAP